MLTVTATAHKGTYVIVGEKEKLTVDSFLKLQTFPQNYKLPQSKSLSIRIIGNAVPPLFMQKLAEHIKGVI